MDRLSAMQLYCQIVEAGQLSLAADQLNLSKGTVSKQLAKWTFAQSNHTQINPDRSGCCFL